jgi:Na+/melibiose symporter-like transporter
LGWEEKEMSLSQNLYLILVAVAIILPAWMIISAYNKRVKQIEELREEVEKLKRKDQRRE